MVSMSNLGGNLCFSKFPWCGGSKKGKKSEKDDE